MLTGVNRFLTSYRAAQCVCACVYIYIYVCVFI